MNTPNNAAALERIEAIIAEMHGTSFAWNGSSGYDYVMYRYAVALEKELAKLRATLAQPDALTGGDKRLTACIEGIGLAKMALMAGDPVKARERLNAISDRLDALTSQLDVDALTQEIRRVDGDHSLAVDVLAEALAPYIVAPTSQPSGGGRTPDELTFGPAAKTLEELRSELEADDVADLINDEAVDTGNFIHDPLYKALDELYRRGWTDLHKGRDYDPRGTDEWGAVLDLFRKHRTNPAADAPAGSGEWVAGSPAVPGIYRVRGWHVGRPTDTAVVEVVDLDGVLWCNLHCDNSERDIEGEWDTVANFNPRFEWQPLTAALAPKPEGEL